MWDLLFGYVVYEFPFMRSDDPGEEVPGEKVDANVGRRVGQRSVLISHLGGFVSDLRVLHHLVFAVDLAGDTHSLGWEPLGDDLVSAFRALADTVACEDRVAHPDQDVVDAVELDVLHPTSLHVVQNSVLVQGPVKSSVTVRGTGNL